MKKKLKTQPANSITDDQVKKAKLEEPPDIKLEHTEPADCYDPKSIFITNLQPDVTEADLAAYFQGMGDIAKLTVLRDKMTGFSRGSAYLQFYDARSVTPALTLTNTYIRDSFVIVQKKKMPTNPPKQVVENNNVVIEEPDSIYVGNLDWRVDDYSLAQVFQFAGDIKRLTIMKKTSTAYIQFKEDYSVGEALNLNGYPLHGRELRVQRKRKLSN